MSFLRWCLLWGLVLASASAGVARADSLDDIFRAGNEAYFAGRHGDAARAYERLVELGVRDADVYFNLGTAYARQRQDGRAIAAFERALRVAPGDADAASALDRCRARVAALRAERDGEVVVESGASAFDLLFGSWPDDALALAVLAFAALLFGGLAAWPWLVREAHRLGVGVALPIALLGLTVTAAGLGRRAGAFDEGTPSVVVTSEAALREGPRADADPRGDVVEGERAWIVGREGGFARVRLSGGRSGWLSSDALVDVSLR